MVNTDESNHQILFSIIVPIYNVDKWLDKCLSSIKNQIYKDFECLLINDGSTDSSLDICNSYAENDNRFKVFTKENGGLVSARNTGIQNAQGEFIVYVDADDWVKKDLLQTCASIIKKNNPDMIIYNYTKVFADFQEDVRLKWNDYDKDIAPGLYNKKRLKNEIYDYIFQISTIDLTAWRCIYRKELLLNHYCKNEKIVRGEDYAFTYECVYYADSIYFLDQAMYFYNQTNIESLQHNNELDINKLVLLHEYMSERFASFDENIKTSLYKYFLNTYFSILKNVVDRQALNKARFLLRYLRKEYNKKVMSMLNHIYKYVPLSYRDKVLIFCLQHRLFKLFALFYLVDQRIYKVFQNLVF